MLKKDVHGFIVSSVTCVSSALVSASQLVLAVVGGGGHRPLQIVARPPI